MEKEKTQNKKVKPLEVVAWVGVFAFFLFSLICLIVRVSGPDFYLFGHRYDVVLTDSMSYKNPEHAEELKDCNNQFQPFDLAVSEHINKAEDLKKFDVVIYTDRNIGTNMHRIVNIESQGTDDVLITNATISTLYSNKGFSLNEIDSHISAKGFAYSEVTMVTYSLEENPDTFNFNIQGKSCTPTVTTRYPNQSGGGYEHTYKIIRSSNAPAELIISHKNYEGYDRTVVKSIQINAKNGKIDMSPDSTYVTQQGADYIGKFNEDFRFEIRGDAAKTSDGIYTFNEIQAKVVGNVPKAGYVFRFLGSMWGGIMFALLGFLIIAIDIIAARMNKKEIATVKAEASNAPKVEENKKVEKTPKTKQEKVQKAENKQTKAKTKTKVTAKNKGGKK